MKYAILGFVAILILLIPTITAQQFGGDPDFTDVDVVLNLANPAGDPIDINVVWRSNLGMPFGDEDVTTNDFGLAPFKSKTNLVTAGPFKLEVTTTIPVVQATCFVYPSDTFPDGKTTGVWVDNTITGIEANPGDSTICQFIFDDPDTLETNIDEILAQTQAMQTELIELQAANDNIRGQVVALLQNHVDESQDLIDSLS